MSPRDDELALLDLARDVEQHLLSTLGLIARVSGFDLAATSNTVEDGDGGHVVSISAVFS